MAIEAVSEQRGQAAKTASRQRYGLLLIDLIATFLVLGIVEPGDLQRVIGSVLVGSALLLALHAARAKPRTQRIALVLVVAVVLGVVVAILANHNSRTVVGLAAVANGLMIALAPPAVAIGVYRHLKAEKTVTIIVVTGVMCLYLLVGLLFAFAYIGIQNLGGAPFFANGAAADSPRSIYFSFATLTTTGYGDYTARTNLGHTLSVSEALLGQIYLVTVVAALVGRLVPRRRPRSQ